MDFYFPPVTSHVDTINSFSAGLLSKAVLALLIKGSDKQSPPMFQ